jgi:hypothetical protein
MLTATAPAQAGNTDSIHRLQCLEQAARCRRQAFAASDRRVAEELLSTAAELERNAWLASRA